MALFIFYCHYIPFLRCEVESLSLAVLALVPGPKVDNQELKQTKTGSKESGLGWCWAGGGNKLVDQTRPPAALLLALAWWLVLIKYYCVCLCVCPAANLAAARESRGGVDPSTCVGPELLWSAASASLAAYCGGPVQSVWAAGERAEGRVSCLSVSPPYLSSGKLTCHISYS